VWDKIPGGNTHIFFYSNAIILPTELVATAMFFEGSKNNSRSFIYGESSANPANVVKIGPVDVEIIDLAEIAKNIF